LRRAARHAIVLDQPSDHFFERRRRLEANCLPSLYLDRLAGTGIQPLARLGLADDEGAKAWQSKASVLLQLPNDRFNDVASSLIGSGARQLGRFLDNLGDEGF
jgi:hypothetical protein